jgi:N-acyl-D-amino-acid deacylase
MPELLVKNVSVIDGTGNPSYHASLGISDGRIAFIHRGEVTCEAPRVIDGTGLVCAPGFIDVHTHSDTTISANNHATNSLRAGVTTEATGQCGSSVAPAIGQAKEVTAARMADRSNASGNAGAPDWESLDDWLQMLDRRGTGINIAPYVGHGTIRTIIMGREGSGGESICPSPEQMGSMKDLLRECMEQGAAGMSTGLEYPPGRYATTSELTELAKVVAHYGGIHISHMRSEEELLLTAVKEIIAIAEGSGVTSCVTHHKAFRQENWGKIRSTLAHIDEARRRGVDIICDFYPWEYSHEQNMGSFFAVEFGPPRPRNAKDLLSVFTDDAKWAALKAALLEGEERSFRIAEARSQALAKSGVTAPPRRDTIGRRVVVHSPAHPEVIGLNLRAAATALGYPADHREGLRKLYVDDGACTLVGGGPMWIEDIRLLVAYPWAAVSTDSSTLDKPVDMTQPSGDMHPRNHGSYARVLQQFVREEKLISLESAVRKMTSLPASLLGLRDRGLVCAGYCADLCLFDAAEITNQATWAKPDAHPIGIKYVLVNGVVAVDNGKETGALAGKALRCRT